MNNSPYLPLAVALPRMVERIEADLTSQDATAPSASGIDPGAGQAGAGRSPPDLVGLPVARTGRR
jgi:hypothetical protein